MPLATASDVAHRSARLAALHRYATRYEIVATWGQERRLVGYLRNVSRGSIMRLVGDLGPLLADSAGIQETDTAAYTRARGWDFGGKLAIGPSGRTEREAILEGEPAPIA